MAVKPSEPGEQELENQANLLHPNVAGFFALGAQTTANPVDVAAMRQTLGVHTQAGPTRDLTAEIEPTEEQVAERRPQLSSARRQMLGTTGTGNG